MCRAAGRLEPTKGSDADDVRWVRNEELADYRVNDKAGAVIKKARELAAAGF